eukprot:jgi/Ulvmu1/2215/UM013_0061.1
MAIRNGREHMAMKQVSEKTFHTFSADTIMQVVETAARVRDMADLDRPGTEDFFKEQVIRLCEIQTQCDAAAELVKEKFDSYMEADLQTRADMKLSDTLDDDMLTAYETHPLKGVPQKTATWRKWCQEINEHIPEDLEDDDLQIEGGGEFRNFRCVLSQKSIFDLDEPVEDAQQYIWEKRAIIEHIRSNHGHAANPAIRGAMITEAELKPSRRVIREAEKRRRLAATAQEQTMEIL